MAVTVELIGRSGSAGENSSATRKYFARGATSETDAIAAVAGTAPASIGGLVLRNITVDEEVKDGYRCSAQYGMFQRREPPQTGESQFNFEIATQAVKVVVPIGTQTVYGPMPHPPVHLIGDQGIPGQAPEGVEVFEPTHSESETHYLPASAITQAYKLTIKSLVGKVNNALWKGHDPGEVLLSAVSGSRRGADDWEVSFRWQVRENQSNLTIAGISGINKQGWQYLWPRYRLADDGQNLTNEITHVVVATVFRTANLSLLGIGV